MDIDELLETVAELSNQVDELNQQISAAVNANYGAIVLGQIAARDLKRLHNKIVRLIQANPKVTQQNNGPVNDAPKVTQQNKGLDNG